MPSAGHAETLLGSPWRWLARHDAGILAEYRGGVPEVRFTLAVTAEFHKFRRSWLVTDARAGDGDRFPVPVPAPHGSESAAARDRQEGDRCTSSAWPRTPPTGITWPQYPGTRTLTEANPPSRSARITRVLIPRLTAVAIVAWRLPER